MRDETQGLERALGDRAAAGDADAFRLLLGRHQGGVADLVYRLTGDRGATDDLVQETFLRAWKKRVGYRSAYAYSTWLYRIALNLCRDRGRRLRVRADAPALVPAAPAASASAEAERREQAARVREALERLPGPEREIVALRMYRGLSFSEAALVLEVPASTLKSRMQKALAGLRAELTSAAC